MAFEAKVKCDGNGCWREVELDSGDPSDSQNEYCALEQQGWLISGSGGDYCPKCAPIVKAEMEQD
ncbi:hypothetical protein [Shewanella baltica]|uniref:hypothetical protein n=1 Tax=Shewanella baltica TaxID=62322 RepID=UPI00325ECEF9